MLYLNYTYYVAADATDAHYNIVHYDVLQHLMHGISVEEVHYIGAT